MAGAYGKALPRLQAVREARAWSVHELARAAGISHTTIIGAEKGAHVRWATVRALAKALDVTPQALYVDAPEVVTADC